MLLEATAETATNYTVSTQGEVQPLPQGVHSFCWSTDLFIFERSCILSSRGPKLGGAWRYLEKLGQEAWIWITPLQSAHLLGRRRALSHQAHPGCPRWALCPSETSRDCGFLLKRAQTGRDSWRNRLNIIKRMAAAVGLFPTSRTSFFPFLYCRCFSIT